MTDKKATILVAYNQNRVIGCGDAIPWHIPYDLKRFRKLTEGNSVIMGQRTYVSIPTGIRPLFNRFNYVLSKQHSAAPQGKDGPYYVESLERAMREAKNKIYIIGGEQIYRLALNAGIVENILATEVKGCHIGDTYFPFLDNSWISTTLEEYEEFSIKEFKKKTQLIGEGISENMPAKPPVDLFAG